MFKDRVLVWVVEYIVGGVLVVAPMLVLFFWRPGLMDTYIYTVQLFIVCLGVVLISCASSMRQRMLLARRIDALAEQLPELSKRSQKSAAAGSETE